MRYMEAQAPVIPPCAPVAWIRAAASACVVQVMDVPGLLTRGRAAQINELLQGMVTNLPLAHCAKLESMQAFCPSVHGDVAVRVANWALSFCASLPFWSLNPLPLVDALVAAGVSAVCVTLLPPAAAVIVFLGVPAVLVEELLPEGGTSVVAGEEGPAAVPEGDGEGAPPLPAPGFCVKSTNCVPSAMGPLGLAGHDPGGAKGVFCPKGMVPV